MATLKWTNVTGSNTNAGSSSLRTAGDLFGKAFDSFEEIAQGKQDRLVKSNTAEALDNLRQIKTVKDFDAVSDGLNNEALTKKYGTAIDAEAVSKKTDGLRANLLESERQEEQYQRVEKTRTDRKDIFAFQNNLRTARQTRANNDGAYDRLIPFFNDKFKKEGGKADLITFDKATGEPFLDNLSEPQRKEFIEGTKGQGGVLNYLTANENIASLRKFATQRGMDPAIFNESLQNQEILEKAQTDLGVERTANLASAIGDLKKTEELEENRINDTYDFAAEQIAVNPAVSSDTRNKLKTALLEKFSRISNDDRAWSSLSGGDVLLGKIGVFLDTPIITDSNKTVYPSAADLEPILFQNLDQGEGLFINSDVAVDFEKAAEQVRANVRRDDEGGLLARRQVMIQSKHNAIAANVANTRAKSATATQRAYIAGGVVQKSRGAKFRAEQSNPGKSARARADKFIKETKALDIQKAEAGRLKEKEVTANLAAHKKAQANAIDLLGRGGATNKSPTGETVTSRGIQAIEQEIDKVPGVTISKEGEVLASPNIGFNTPSWRIYQKLSNAYRDAKKADARAKFKVKFPGNTF